MQLLKGKFHLINTNETIIIDEKIDFCNQSDFNIIHSKEKKDLIYKYFESLKNNISPLLVNPSLSHEDIENIRLKHCKNKYPLGHITCSSGTTSQNMSIKTFDFSLEKIVQNAQAHYKSLDVHSSVNILFPLPFYHSFGAVVGLIGTSVFNHNLYFFEQTPTNEELIDNLTKKEIDLLYLTPALLRVLNKYLKRKKIKILSKIKISIGAAHLYKSDLEELYNSFPNSEIYYTYGLSEAGPRVSTYKLPNDKNNILDHNDLLPIGEVIDDRIKLKVVSDQLIIDSPFSFKDEEIATNDEVFRSEVGNIYILGRSDFMINFGGINIYPEELEAKLSLCLSNENYVICAQESKIYGQIPVLVIEGQEAIHKDKNITLDFVNKILPEHLSISRIAYIDQFPRTSMGKILRKQLKNLINLA